MNDAWDAPWNDFTAEIALLIDNDDEQLSKVLTLAQSSIEFSKNNDFYGVEDIDQKERIILALKLEDYLRNLLGHEMHRNFVSDLQFVLLTSVFEAVNWHGLAAHYLTTVKEKK